MMSNPSGSNNSGRIWSGLSYSTLYIGPLEGELRRDEILSHFSVFGDVKEVQIHNETKHSYGFVKFTLAESAAKALEVDCHVFAGRRVDVVVADDWHPDKTTLLDLNDDCILEILSMKCLGIIDLCSAAEACRRLKGIASGAFKRQHKVCDIFIWSEGETKTAKRILRNFGSEIRHLRIGGVNKEWSIDILTSVAEHCSTTLESLDLQYSEIHENLTAELRQLFKNLQKLAIRDCPFVGASKELLADCESLVALSICPAGAASILENTFPKLQQFEYYSNAGTMESFVSRHLNLKSLKLWHDIESSVFQRIANCKQLEILTCNIPENATLDLSNLCHLREVDIVCSRGSVTKTAPGLNKLQLLIDLTLCSANIDPEFVQALSHQLKGLRVLKLHLCTELQNLNRIDDLGQLESLEIMSIENDDLDVSLLVNRLSKLKYLRLVVRAFNMDLVKFLRVVDVVGRRPDKTKLKLMLYCSEPHDYDHLLPAFSRNAHVVQMIIVRLTYP